MSDKKSKIDFSKLKEIASMDIKDIGTLFKKEENQNANYPLGANNKAGKNFKFKEKTRNVLSIDLGTNIIKIAEGKYQKDKLTVNKLLQIITPEGAIADGKITNEEAIINTLEFLIKENNIKAKDLIFTTNSSSIINRDILVPKVQEEEMETVIRYEIQQYLPINLDDYIVQYVVLDEIVDDSGAKLKINVTSFPEKIAASYYNVVEALELNPYALDVTYNSINKLANYSHYTTNNGKVMGGTVAFVDMGATSINMAIFKNGKLDFTRMIKSGGDNIDYALSQSLNMSIKSTESLKIKDGDLLSDKEEDALNATIRNSVDEILEELERILQFYSNKSNITIDKIYIYGGVSNLKNIDLYMENRLNMSVEKINDIPNVDFTTGDFTDENLGEYLNAISAIIRL